MEINVAKYQIFAHVNNTFWTCIVMDQKTAFISIRSGRFQFICEFPISNLRYNFSRNHLRLSKSISCVSLVNFLLKMY